MINKYFVGHLTKRGQRGLSMILCGMLLTSGMVMMPQDAEAKKKHARVIVAAPKGAHPVVAHGDKYLYAGGVFYRRGPKGVVIVDAPMGAVVPRLPGGYTTVVVSGTTYYLAGGVYYRYSGSGYVVVEAPVRTIAVQSAPVVISPQDGAAGEVVVKAGLLNVRTGPGKHHSVVFQIPRGSVLSVQGRAPGWYYVQLPNDQYGWVMEKFTSSMKLSPQG